MSYISIPSEWNLEKSHVFSAVNAVYPENNSRDDPCIEFPVFPKEFCGKTFYVGNMNGQLSTGFQQGGHFLQCDVRITHMLEKVAHEKTGKLRVPHYRRKIRFFKKTVENSVCGKFFSHGLIAIRRKFHTVRLVAFFPQQFHKNACCRAYVQHFCARGQRSGQSFKNSGEMMLFAGLVISFFSPCIKISGAVYGIQLKGCWLRRDATQATGDTTTVSVLILVKTQSE